MNPFSKIIKIKNKHERQEQALERELDWKWIDKIEKLRYQLPNSVVTNEIDLWQGDRIIGWGNCNETKRIIRDEKLRLLSLILAYSGLSWVECGKGDAFQIQRSITGPVLAGCRVKTKEKYTLVTSWKELRRGVFKWEEPQLGLQRRSNPKQLQK